MMKAFIYYIQRKNISLSKKKVHTHTEQDRKYKYTYVEYAYDIMYTLGIQHKFCLPLTILLY